MLSEIEDLRRPMAVEGESRWKAEYLSRTAVLYQFNGYCHSNVQSEYGCVLDGASGELSRLGGADVSQVLGKFAINPQVLFYNGNSSSVAAILREIVPAGSLQLPEVMLIETVCAFAEGNAKSATRLAFVGYDRQQLSLQPFLSPERRLHAAWFQNREQPVAVKMGTEMFHD